MDHNEKWHSLVRGWVRRTLRSKDFILMADWIGRKSDAVMLVHRIGSTDSYNRALADAFIDAAQRKVRV